MEGDTFNVCDIRELKMNVPNFCAADYCSVLLKGEFFIKMRASYLQPSSLQYSSFLKEGGSKAGSSHFNEKLSFWWDTTVLKICLKQSVSPRFVCNKKLNSLARSRPTRWTVTFGSPGSTVGWHFLVRTILLWVSKCCGKFGNRTLTSTTDASRTCTWSPHQTDLSGFTQMAECFIHKGKE